MKSFFNTLLFFATTSFLFADNFYFTQGSEGQETYTRNWSDLNNWSTVEVSTSTSDVGNKWNTNPATSAVTGVGTKIYIGYYSAKNGTTLGTVGQRYVNVDVKDVVVSSIEFQNRSNTADHIRGEALTFETTSGGGSIIIKNRDYKESIIDNDIILNTTSAGAISYKISNSTSNDLILNGKITVNGTMNSSSWEPLTVYSSFTTSGTGKGNVYLNGQLSFSRCLVVEKSGSGLLASKVYIQGTGDNTQTLKVRNGAAAVLNKDAGYLAAGSYEIYAGGRVEVMSHSQISSNNNITTTTKSANSDNISGYLLTHGNDVSVGNITIKAGSDIADEAMEAQYFNVDFGTEIYGESRTFSFKKVYIANTNNRLDASKSGILFSNYDPLTDLIFSQDTAAPTVDYSDRIFLEGYGVKGVDYIIKGVYDAGTQTWSYSMVIPEPADFAILLGLISLGFIAYKRRGKHIA